VAAELVAFLGVSAVVICTPGQDTALTIRNTLAGGRREGVATAAGVALGQAAWTVATAAGIASLVAASRPAFVALQLAGAVYLVLLGLQTLARALLGGRRTLDLDPGARATPREALRQGLLSNLANPKMAAFFTSLLPQFAAAGALAFPTLLALGLLFSLLTFSWLCLYSLAVARARHVLLRDRVRRLLEAVTGAVLVALGLRIATQRA
jgi:threonine/homoserine/homoserine lactone efflux protein